MVDDLCAARLIAVDWGSTGLRVFLLGADGALLATRSAAQGASVLKGAQSYADTLEQLAGDWLRYVGTTQKTLPVIACGMVGSQHGWQEVAYVDCPADASQLAAGLALVNGAALQIAPGLICRPAGLPPDVMRGEETQIIGALHLQPSLVAASCIVMPGTHSKWAHIRQGQVIDFATHMTGELFAVLRQHSVLGRLIPAEVAEAEATEQHMPAFLAGVDAARNEGHLGLSHQLFAVRTLGLTAQLPATALADYLSGLLIGHDLRAGLLWRDTADLSAAPLVLLGEPHLCQRYAEALARFDVAANFVLPNTAPAGLWCLALAAGLLASLSASSSPIATEVS
ncbi:MAG: 2-dehydro-3-deoxygalactonokinase [Candidatus Aquirickettsiella gammari]